MRTLGFVLLLALLAAACSPQPAPGPTARAPAPTPTPPARSLTPAPAPTTTPVPRPTPAPTATPFPTPNPTQAALFKGSWVSVPNVPVGAWSAALLPTGKVLLFQSGAAMYLWDPKMRQFGPRFASQTNLFCAGLALLADGRLLAAGGHEGKDPQDHFLGVKSAEVFDPWQEKWTRLPDMAGGERWYPTALTLADGRVLVASGTHAGKANEAVEILDPERREWKVVAQKQLPTYPWMAVMPSGEVLLYGPQNMVELLDLQGYSLRRVAARAKSRSGGAGVLLDGLTGEVLALGGGSPTTSTGERLGPEGRLTAIAPMAAPRHHLNAVLLPDRRVLAVGGHLEGGQKEDKEDITKAVMLTESFEPQRGVWWEVGTASYPHGYHSTALLLPDGSVMAAGPLKNLEVFYPWYFARPRPALDSLPEAVGYGQSFRVVTGDAQRVARVVLIRLGSATHGLNTDQRYLELEFAPEGGSLAVKSPARAEQAVPGYYLLFVVTAEEVPSEGRFILVR